ncbi:MAG: CerR family C-terminal domain-containing protein [Desulfomicrobium apsheronum]|nr:CerR family C-terminal domain-containing protein [Desulfomicrobium apsheronum]
MNIDLLHESTPSRADRARLRLLEAGLQCFADLGLHGVTIREIARVAGQNSAAITYYFGGKEGLYGAVLDAVLRFFRNHVREASQTWDSLNETQTSPEQALELLKRIQRGFAMGILTDAKAAQFAMLMVREQTQPTAAFEALYQGTVEPLHRMVSHILARITGDDPESPRAVLRAHTLIGQLQSFVMARETLLRRMGWDGYDAERAAAVADMLAENLDIFVAGLNAPAEPKPEYPS